MAMEKAFDSQTAEARWRETWESSGHFQSDPSSAADPYTIMMPPPNVTGTLHMGHGLTFTLQDVLIRYNRMRGKDTLWQPGTDHAGIAVQAIIDRKLDEEGLTKHDISRDEFLERAWAWKEESGSTITRQLRYLGTTPDWHRERFTMDEGLSRAVKEVFIRLYREGIIYKDTRLVNWDPKLRSAISDLEVESKDINGNLWHFRYPLADDARQHIVVATTRPETMLGDTGVAVHPDDERYKHLIGKMVRLPLVGRDIPIVADEYADPEQGSGAVKITPAHDFNDYEVGRRAGLDMINIMTKDATLNENVPAEYQGMDRFEARKKVVADLEALGLLEKIDDHPHAVPHGDRSGVVIEPYLTEQWYANAEVLAKPCIEAVETGKTTIFPKNYEKIYFQWMRNIEPWCISRQLIWGHQIPAWYGPDGKVFVADDEAAAQSEAEAHYGEVVTLTRDPDVLDTWFSSALWPFSTLGWPDTTEHLKKYYPGDVLATGWDILFFWVARMMMMGMHFMDDVPFKTVYIHTLVRDEHGQKMSKSKGNVIDPLDVIEQYGTDALRFTLTSLAAPGRDIRLSTQRVEGNRNFATKLWNACKFAEMNEAAITPGYDPAAVTLPLNQWLVSRMNATLDAVEAAVDGYRFHDMAGGLYHFIWDEYCSWYLELSKPVFWGDDEAQKTETRSTMAWALEQLLHMLHPIMPFVTEEIWDQFAAAAAGKQGTLLLGNAWPTRVQVETSAAASEIDWLIRVVVAIRSARSDLNVPAGGKFAVKVQGADATTLDKVSRHNNQLVRQANLESIEPLQGDLPKGAAQIVVDEVTYVLPLEGLIDISAETARLQKAIEKAEAAISKVDKQLSNENFVSKAPAEAIEKAKASRAEAEGNRSGLLKALERLQSL